MRRIRLSPLPINATKLSIFTTRERVVFMFGLVLVYMGGKNKARIG